MRGFVMLSSEFCISIQIPILLQKMKVMSFYCSTDRLKRGRLNERIILYCQVKNRVPSL